VLDEQVLVARPVAEQRRDLVAPARFKLAALVERRRPASPGSGCDTSPAVFIAANSSHQTNTMAI
jgi:hypothetical protein